MSIVMTVDPALSFTRVEISLPASTLFRVVTGVVPYQAAELAEIARQYRATAVHVDATGVGSIFIQALAERLDIPVLPVTDPWDRTPEVSVAGS